MLSRLLFISNLFPDAIDPIRGLDNAAVLHRLREDHSVDIRALAIRPTLAIGGKRKQITTMPCRSQDEVFQPTYAPAFYVPKIGSRWNDSLMRGAVEKAFCQIVEEFQPEVILTSWLYPDGCALAPLCESVGIPLVLITQGSDTHQYLEDPIRRKKILEAIAKAEAVICRSGDLARRLEAAGAQGGKLKAIYNGVDTTVFRPADAGEARRKLGLPAAVPLMLFVGNLLPVKNPELLLRSHAEVNTRRKAEGTAPAHLIMIGAGPMKDQLLELSAELGSESELTLAGRLPSEMVARYMQAADFLVLSSLNEGFPNVILEAFAAGLPVLSTNVGGISELLEDGRTGMLVPSNDQAAYTAGIEQMIEFKAASDAPASEDYSWEKAATRYRELLESCL